MYTKEYLQSLLDDCNCKTDLCKKLNISSNGRGMKIVDSLIMDYNLLPNFDTGKKQRTLIILKKICPVCKKEFTTKNFKGEKTVCSRACSNTYFRSGLNNGMYKNGANQLNPHGRRYNKAYRVICFSHYEYKCYYPGCDWNLCLDVHHIDENHKNNDIKNLIPLCPNHHKLTTINKHKEEVRKIIQEVVDKTLGV